MHGTRSCRLVNYISVSRPANAGGNRKFKVRNLFTVEVPQEAGRPSLAIRMKIEGDVDFLIDTES